MKNIQEYDLLICINSIETDELIFNKDEIYLCTTATKDYIKLSKIVDRYKEEINYKDCSTFVFDSKVFDAPNISKHFRLYESRPEGNVLNFTYNGYWDKEIYYDHRWRYCNNRPEKISFSDVLENDNYNQTPYVTISNGEPVVGLRLKLDAWKLENLKRSKYLLDLYIDIKCGDHPYNRDLLFSKIDLGSNLINLMISNTDKEQISINSLKIPNKLQNLSLSNVLIDRLPDVKKCSVILRYCKVKDLSLKKISNFEFSDLEFDTYDNLFFKTAMIVDDFYNDNITNLVILKIDDNSYAISDSNKILTKKEVSIFCATFQLYDAMILFGFDLKTKYEFSNQYDNNDKLNFNFYSKKKSVKVFKEGDIFRLRKYVTFDYYRLRSHLVYSKEKGIHLSSDVIYSIETINDELLSTIMKLTENEIFIDGFFDDFVDAVNNTKSKFIGEIDIKDFKWDMITDNEDDIISLSYKHKNKIWSIEYHNETKQVQSMIIDWGQQTFKLKNLNEDKLYLYPNKNKYYKNLHKYGRDDMYIINYDKYDKPTYDESIKYSLTFNKKALERNGFMFLNHKLYKNRDSESFYKDEIEYRYNNTPNDYNWVNRFYDNITCEIDDAKELAKKYNFKLDIKHVNNNNYSNIEKIKYESSSDHSDMFYDLISFNGGLHKLFNQQNPLHIKSNDYPTAVSQIIKIGDNIIYLGDRYYNIIEKTDDIILNQMNKVDIIKLLKKYKSFSYLNTQFRKSTLEKSKEFVKNNVSNNGKLKIIIDELDELLSIEIKKDLKKLFNKTKTSSRKLIRLDKYFYQDNKNTIII